MWREGVVPGGDTRFHVRALGHGDDLVVLLHGWPQDGTAWDRVAPLLAAEGWRVVAPDLRGFGRTVRGAGRLDAALLADELEQLIRGLHARRALVVGHDWGGAVGIATAFRHPGRVSGLVVVSSPYRHVDLRSAWAVPLMNVPVLPELAFAYAAAPLVSAALRAAAVVTEGLDQERRARYAEAVASDPAGWLAYARRLSAPALRGVAWRRVRRMVPGLPDPAPPPRLRVPALVVWGAQDRVTPVELGARTAADLRAELEILDGVGHLPPDEDPLGLARAIQGFGAPLRALPAAS